MHAYNTEGWDLIELRTFGGSTDGVWEFHVDWDGYGPDNVTERESVADGQLQPE